MGLEASAAMRFEVRTARLPAVALGWVIAVAGCNTATGFRSVTSAVTRSDAVAPEPRGCAELDPCGGTGGALPASLIGLAVVVGLTIAHQVLPR
jgi:hypothetical protein